MTPTGDDARPQRRAATAAMEDIEDRMDEEEEEEDDDSFIVKDNDDDDDEEEEEEEDKDSEDEESGDDDDDEDSDDDEDEDIDEAEAKIAKIKARKGAKMERSKDAIAKEDARSARLGQKEDAQFRDKSHLADDDDEDDDDDCAYDTGFDKRFLRDGDGDESVSPSFIAFKFGASALIDRLCVKRLDDCLAGRILSVPSDRLKQMQRNNHFVPLFNASLNKFVKKATTFIPVDTTLFRITICMTEMVDYDWYAIPRLVEGGAADASHSRLRKCSVTGVDFDNNGFVVAMTRRDKDTGKFSLVHAVVSQQVLSFIRAWFTVTRIREIILANVASIVQASVAESPFEAPWDHIASFEDDDHRWIAMHYHEYYLARKIVSSELGFEDPMLPRVLKG
jgi:hypothetical protein